MPNNPQCWIITVNSRKKWMKIKLQVCLIFIEIIETTSVNLSAVTIINHYLLQDELTENSDERSRRNPRNLIITKYHLLQEELTEKSVGRNPRNLIITKIVIFEWKINKANWRTAAKQEASLWRKFQIFSPCHRWKKKIYGEFFEAFPTTSLHR